MDGATTATSRSAFGMRKRRGGKKKSSTHDTNTNNAVSTTKAHLISIVAPRRFTPALYLENDEHVPASDHTVGTNKTSSTDSEDAKEVTASKVTFHDQVKKEDLSSKKAAGYSTAEVMASPFAYAAGGFSKNVEAKDEKAALEQTATSLSQDSLSSLDESRDDDEEDDEEGAEVTPEEAEGIKRNDELNNTEVNVEHLLRVVFKNLFKEKCLVSAPTFTIIDGPAFDNKCPTVDASSWIQIEVMVLPPAIGIVLQRLERIGVGHDVGSVSIYKAELCKASSLAVYDQEQTSKEIDGGSDHTTKSEPTLKSIEAAKSEWKMAATILRIEQVREQVRLGSIVFTLPVYTYANCIILPRVLQIVEASEFNFDFIALVTIASILAGVGLITNNTGTSESVD